MYFAAGQGFRAPLAGFGVNPTATGGGRFTTPTEGGAYTPEATAEGVATSDGNLIFSRGEWRVLSDPKERAQISQRIDKTSHQIADEVGTLYVGPFAWNPKNGGGQVTPYIAPSQVPMREAWGKWLADASSAVWSGLSKEDQARFADTRARPYLPALVEHYKLVGDAQKVGKQMNQCPSGCDCASDPMCGALWALGASALWENKDEAGVPTEFVTYPNDPYTYGFYTPWNWLESMKPGLSTQPGSFFTFIEASGWASTGGHLYDAIASRLFSYDRTDNLPPIARFKNPLTDEDWGMWLVLNPDAGDIAIGAWNSATDRPNSYTFNVAFGPIPQEPWYAYIGDAIMWLPAKLGELADDLISALEGLVCSDPAQARAIAGADPRAQAAIATLSMLCPKGPPMIDCRDPRNATVCTPKPPWWQTWMILLPIAGVVFASIVLARPHKQKGAQQ
jgi:hypothetical protein